MSYRRTPAGTWEVKVYLGADPATGRKRYRTRNVSGRERDAHSLIQSKPCSNELREFVERDQPARHLAIHPALLFEHFKRTRVRATMTTLIMNQLVGEHSVPFDPVQRTVNDDGPLLTSDRMRAINTGR